jgi:nitrate/nitrite transport system substrate-binding protein
MGATAAGMALSSCAISGDRSAKGLTEEARAIKQIVNPGDLEKSDITVGYVPVNDCALCDRMEKRIFPQIRP